MREALHPIAPRLPRARIERAIQALVDLLDEIDGDPDSEEMDAEDSFALGWYALATEGPGCPVADPGGGAVDDELQESESAIWPAYGSDQTAGPVRHESPEASPRHAYFR